MPILMIQMRLLFKDDRRILAYLLCWLVLHGLKACFLRSKCAIGQYPLPFFMLPSATVLIYLELFFKNEGEKWTEYSFRRKLKVQLLQILPI